MGINPTTYQEIYEKASIKFKSYELDEIFNQSIDSYEIIMKEYLNSSIYSFVEFEKDCKSLEEYMDDVMNSFTFKLKGIVVEILAFKIVLAWVDSQMNDLLAIKNALTDSDFKLSSSTANMLTANMSKRAEIQKIIDDLVFKYTYFIKFKNDDY